MDTLPGLDFAAIDFEAANSDRSSACAVGITPVRDGIVTDSRSWLIRPHTGLETFDARIAIEIGRRRGATSVRDLYRGLGIA